MSDNEMDFQEEIDILASICAGFDKLDKAQIKRMLWYLQDRYVDHPRVSPPPPQD